MKLLLIVHLLLVSFIATTAHSNNDAPNQYTGIIYPDDVSTSFLKAVLTSMQIPFTQTSTPKGKYIKWASKGEAHRKEIENRVSQYIFIKEVCKNLPLPKPEEPAREKLSC